MAKTTIGSVKRLTLDHLKRVESYWGHEIWIVNKPEYCGKLLFFKKGHKLSLHYHRIKDETFYLQSGHLKVRLRYQDGQDEYIEMLPGDSMHIPPGQMHQMEGLEDSELFEFSTQHFDDDSYRVEKGI